jgi:hypothetical protein
VALTVVDTEDREPTDQEQEDYNAAMDMSAGELVAVATAYMRRLRADAAWDEAMERDLRGPAQRHRTAEGEGCRSVRVRPPCRAESRHAVRGSRRR